MFGSFKEMNLVVVSLAIFFKILHCGYKDSVWTEIRAQFSTTNNFRRDRHVGQFINEF